ncbi:MAG: hypothetical protein J0L77_07040 [Alphaproteobacteria bacterium]|nr:hypothetical protein [Alphaproteobacteria bacterium]
MMKVLTLLLVFAIGFGGYSAAAHAFGADSCNPVALEKMADMGMDMADCPGHQADQDQQKDSDQSKSSKAKCMNCTHCCTSHVMSAVDYGVSFIAQASVLTPTFVNFHVGDFLYSLKRPPKSLV